MEHSRIRQSEHDVPLRVLLVEDDSAYAEFTTVMLQSVGVVRFELDHTASMRTAVEQLTAESYDVVLLDLGLPDAQGLEALNNLAVAAPDLPLVILSGPEDESLALQAMKDGAQDYLIKGEATSDLLVRAIRYAIERKQTELHIKHLAYYDSLTQLPNRCLLTEHLGLTLKRASRTSAIVGVFFVDIDRFKQINDAFGHSVGDSVLTQLADRLSRSLRRSDTLGRLSGDEFVAIVEVAHRRELPLVAESLRRCLKPPFSVPNGELFVTISVGVSSFPADGADCGELLRNADHAMYRAKAEGRDTVCFYTAPIDAERSVQPTPISALRLAVERNELLLHFQPLVNLRTGRTDGLEALVRWQHPSLGIVPPSEFIHLAEESDLILSIERWALRAAMAQTLADPRARSLRLAINLSRRQFEGAGLIGRLRRVIQDVGYDPHLLELEVTETGIMQHPARVLHHLNACRDLGIQVTVDDFGTGYSCLGVLRNFPLSALKIDRSFVRNCSADVTNRSIVTGIIRMGHAWGLEVIAEGVETEAELTYLREQGCDRAQGWFLGPAVPRFNLPTVFDTPSSRSGSSRPLERRAPRARRKKPGNTRRGIP